MNIELSKNAVIAIIVVALLVVGLVFMKVSKPPTSQLPEGYDPYRAGPGAPAPR